MRRQRRLGATNDSDDDESLLLERPESTVSMSGPALGHGSDLIRE